MHGDTTSRRPVRLHLIHDLGGGSAKWLGDFGRGDVGAVDLVLRSFTHDDNAGRGVALYADPFQDEPIQAWTFATGIPAVAISHPEYRAALDQVIREQSVEQLFVSSLIGHSLEALDTGLPTVVVLHDYFPYCPAINLYFDAPCTRCDDERIGTCAESNPEFNPFAGFGGADRARVRSKYLQLVAQPHIAFAAPSQSVAANLRRLNPAFDPLTFETIPHGYGTPLTRLEVEPRSEDRLRVVVLGQLSVAKGLLVLQEAVDEITRFAELHLVGCREVGELFRFQPHVHVLSTYLPDELATHLKNINPHVGVLASVVPETFGYTLSELMMLGIPPVATRIGSFPERIRHGETGYLYEPNAKALIAMLRLIDSDRALLAAVRGNLRGHRERTPAEMVADYDRLVRRLTPLAQAQPPGLPSPRVAAPAAMEAVTVGNMWKEVKRLHMELTIVNEARAREQKHLRGRADDAMRALEDERLVRLQKQGELLEQERQVEHLSGQLHMRNLQLAQLYRSTSWRLTAPVRMMGHAARRARILGSAGRVMLRRPADIPSTLSTLGRAWRDGGLHEVKKRLIALRPNESYREAWNEYRERFAREVRPRISGLMSEWHTGPLVSVIVPTYETPAAMLREMLDSVVAQLYPRWELCVADDGSKAPHIRQILEEYARRDPRIRLHFEPVNRGVSHASNRALAMATGDAVVLLDHDDVLEEQALFRVAQCFAQDSPDLAYSDEILVSGDGSDIRRFAYRPAFSLEYLRSHPYIVHLVAFRRTLLDEVGGFDESLRISQDYDLILRTAERARRIVHIPEILYRWRLHEGSAGAARMLEVMETSRALLARHLERCGEKGRVEAGAGFNLFDVRRPLREGLRVAIVIPTKNRWDLVKQCIESLRATISAVAYDIVVVDHESDEPATRRYLESISSFAKVVAYRGEFNFSAINNHAISVLDGSHTHYLFCNNDIEATAPGWLERMLELAQQPSVGVVGAKLLYPDRKSIQHAGVCVGAFGAAEHYGKWLRFPDEPVEPGYAELLMVDHEVSAVTAACMLARKDAFESAGGFDESIAVGFGDVDLCLRIAQKGYRVVFCPHAELVHHESATRGKSVVDPHPRDSVVFRTRWNDLLEAGDPYYSPGLSLSSTKWALRRPLYCSFAIRRRIVSRDPEGFERISFSPLADLPR